MWGGVYIAEELDCMNPMRRIGKSYRSGLEPMNNVRKSEVFCFGLKAGVMTESEKSRSSKFATGSHNHDQLHREVT